MLRQAAAHWEAALAVNPLHAEGWFALGFCALKVADAGRAAQAFTRAAQQDPDNGEAWNNLAAVHLQARALLKLHCSRDSWAALAVTRDTLPSCKAVLMFAALSVATVESTDMK